MDARAAADRVRQLYTDYLEEYSHTERDGWLNRLLQGGPSRAERKSVTDFYAAVEQAVAELAGCLTPADSAAAAETVRFMLLETKGPDTTAQLTFVAAQPLVIPLLDRLSREEAASLLADYTARYPRKSLLTPRQKDLLNALEQRA